jgi:hypothetical protein
MKARVARSETFEIPTFWFVGERVKLQAPYRSLLTGAIDPKLDEETRHRAGTLFVEFWGIANAHKARLMEAATKDDLLERMDNLINGAFQL